MTDNAQAKKNAGNRTGLGEDEYEFNSGDEGTPRRSRKKDKDVKQRELAKLAEQLPAIHAAFPHSAIFKPDDELSVKWHRCLICNKPYKVDRRRYHYEKEHGPKSTQPCPPDLKESIQQLEFMVANATTKYVFDCVSLPCVTTQQSLDAYRGTVTNMKENGIDVENEQYLTQMQASLPNIPISNVMQTPTQFSPFGNIMAQSAATPFHQGFQQPFMQHAGTYNQAQFYGAFGQQTPVIARRRIQMNVQQTPLTSSDNIGNEEFDEFAPPTQPIYQQNDDIEANTTNTLEGFNYADKDEDMSIGNNAPFPTTPSSIPQKLPIYQTAVLSGSLDSISAYTTEEPLPVFKEDVQLADMLDLTRDTPARYQNPAAHIMYKVRANQRMQKDGLYRHLRIDQHPLLSEYRDYLLREYLVRSFGRTAKSMEDQDIEQPGNKGGRQVYFQYIRKWGMIIQRARNRGAKPLTLDDLIFCGPIAQIFIEHLIEGIQHGGSTILQYCKSLLHCLEWVKAQKKLTFGPTTQRGVALADSIAKCTMLVKNNRSMTELKRDSDISLGISKPKEFMRYGLAVEFISHNVFKDIMQIMQKSLEKDTFVPTRIQYNFILSYAMNVLLVTNSSRNELMYKMRNRCSKKENLVPVNVNNKTYYVGKYPNPKQGAKSTYRTKLYQGHFGVTEEWLHVIELYAALRDRVIKESMLERPLLDLQSHFFRTYDLMPLSETSTKNFILSCQTRTKFHGEISCNGVRHATSTLEFWCRRFLTGAQTTAVLLGHSEDIQLMDYDEERVLKVAEAYRYLEQIAQEDLDANGDSSTCDLFDDMIIPDCFLDQDAANELDGEELTIDDEIGEEGDDSDEENEELNVQPFAGNMDAVETVEHDQINEADQHMAMEHNIDQLEDTPMAPIITTLPEEHTVESEIESRKERKRPAENPLQPGQIPLPKPTLERTLNLTDPDVLNGIIREHNERPCTDIPRLSLKNGDRVDFMNRRRSQPIQNWAWVRIYYIPALKGSGLFAKRDIVKNSIVADYNGLATTDDEYKRMTERYSAAHKILADDYVLHIKLDNKKEMAIQAHMPVCDGRLIMGRYANHSRAHPNMETYKEEYDGRFYVYFRAIRNIKEGEQLLWNYGKDYEKKDWYKGSCLCLKCSPNMLPDRTSNLPLQATGWYADPLKASSDQGLTQAIAQGHTPRSILGELVRRAGVDGIRLGDTPACWLDAFKESVRIVGGGYLEPMRTPRPAETPLQEALQQASHDAFVNHHPSVVVVRNSPRDKNPIMILCGSVSSGLRFGNLAVFNQKHQEVHTLEVMDARSFNTNIHVIDELQGCTLVHLKQNNQQFRELCSNTKVALDDIKAFARCMNQR